MIEPVVQLAAGLFYETRSETEMGREAFAESEAIITAAGLPLVTEVLRGDPKEEITNAAARWLADLAVVGSHGRRGLKRLLLGSVSEAVARHAPCSVEVTR